MFTFCAQLQELGYVFTHVRRHQIFLLHREDNGTKTKAMEQYVFSRKVCVTGAKTLLWLYSVESSRNFQVHWSFFTKWTALKFKLKYYAHILIIKLWRQQK